MARVKSPDECDRLKLAAGVRPFHFHYFPKLRSTNDYAVDLRKRGKLFAPAVVVTPTQTEGRGRGRNVWWSNNSCITATFVWPVDESLPAAQIPLIAGLAVRAAAAQLTGKPGIQLKWPNDVLYRGRKLAGILCERIDKLDLIGIGLNVNLDPADVPKALAPAITSLHAIRGEPVNRNDSLISLASHLNQFLLARAARPFAHFLTEYANHHFLTGKKVAITNDGSPRIAGCVVGIDPTGRLIVRDGTKVHHVIAGHVTIV